MAFQKNNLKTMNIVSKTQHSQIFDWDIIVPDSKPDVSEIISTEGIVNITGKEIMQDRAVLNGNVKITILYLASKNDKCIKSIECIQSFNYVLEIENLRQNMTLNIECNVNKISCDLINSRKLNVNCLIDFSGCALEHSEIIYLDSFDEENLICKKETIRTQKIKKCFANSISIGEEVDVPVGKPSIMEILKIKCDIINKDIKFVNNKIVLRGILKISTVYLCDSDTDCTQYMINEMPINEVVECEGIEEQSICEYDVAFKNFNYFLKDNSENEMRIVKISGDIVIDGKIVEEIEISPVVDAYSLCDELDVSKVAFNFEKTLGIESGKITIKDTVYVNTNKEIQKLLLVDTHEKIESIKYINGKISVTGNVLCGILYTSQDDLIYYKNNIIPFEYSMPNDEFYKDAFFEIKTEINNSSYNIISGTEVELRVNIDYNLKVKTNLSEDIVENIEVKSKNSDKKSNHGITVFFCDKDELLWNVAKKYKRTVEDIAFVNELENTELVKKGTKLLIP